MSTRRLPHSLAFAILCVVVLGSCRGPRDAATSGEPQSTYAGSGNRLAYCCGHEMGRPSSPAAAPYAHCEQRIAACKSDDGELKSTGAVPFDATWTEEIRRARRAPSWCCYSWTVPKDTSNSR